MKTDRPSIIAYLQGNLSKKRFGHTLEVEKSALSLARRHGADQEKTRIAALLHDIAKEYTQAKLFEKAEEYDILIDEITAQSPGLLHGPVGAFEAKRIFAVGDADILEAIYYHSTLNSGVGLIAKIIFMADRTEETRTYDGVAEIRKAAEESLDKGIVVALARNMTYELSRHKAVHPRSLAAYNENIVK